MKILINKENTLERSKMKKSWVYCENINSLHETEELIELLDKRNIPYAVTFIPKRNVYSFTIYANPEYFKTC